MWPTFIRKWAAEKPAGPAPTTRTLYLVWAFGTGRMRFMGFQRVSSEYTSKPHGRFKMSFSVRVSICGMLTGICFW